MFLKTIKVSTTAPQKGRDGKINKSTNKQISQFCHATGGKRAEKTFSCQNVCTSVRYH